MAENNINAYCAICNEGYHICNTCKNQNVFKPWRTVTDTVEHYKIYLAIHGFTVTKNKEQAKKELVKCDLSGLESFNPEIKSVINEIMETSVKQKIVSKKRPKLENISEMDNKNNDNE